MPETKETRVGAVTHYYPKIGVAIVALTAPVKVGDTLRFLGHATDFTEVLDSIQVNHEGVASANAGESVGLKVTEPVHEGNGVYRTS